MLEIKIFSHEANMRTRPSTYMFKYVNLVARSSSSSEQSDSARFAVAASSIGSAFIVREAGRCGEWRQSIELFAE